MQPSEIVSASLPGLLSAVTTSQTQPEPKRAPGAPAASNLACQTLQMLLPSLLYASPLIFFASSSVPLSRCHGRSSARHLLFNSYSLVLTSPPINLFRSLFLVIQISCLPLLLKLGDTATPKHPDTGSREDPASLATKSSI